MTASTRAEPSRRESRIALITGASRGLGRALAERLAHDGWTLVLDARGRDALLGVRDRLVAERPNARIEAIPGDITDPEHRAALARAVERLGGCDLVVNNAGTLGPSPLPAALDTPLDALESVFRTNVVAPLGVLQALRGRLRPGAVIVNVTSDAAVSPYAGWGAYGSSKAALEQLSAVLAVENPELRVYWVDPGDMRTEMHQAAFPGEDISDREAPEASVPGIVALVAERGESGRRLARAGAEVTS